MRKTKNRFKEDHEYRHAYADEFLNTMVRTQIRVLREQRGMSQGDLARRIGTTQTAISRLENVNYSSWNIRTLKKIAEAFDLRLHVSFETFGSLDVSALNKEALERALSVDEDPGLASADDTSTGAAALRRQEPGLASAGEAPGAVAR